LSDPHENRRKWEDQKKRRKGTAKMKIAIVTGASSGLGRAFARQLAEREEVEELWLVARREERLRELAAELKKPAKVLALDLTEPESIQTLRQALEREVPDVRVLVNAAGFGKFGTYADITAQEIGDMIALNCRAAVDLTNLAIPYMGRGSHILEICSSAAFQPLPGMNVYAASKAFLLRYSRALRRELRGRGIWVTAVCPGWIKTEFIEVAQRTQNGQTVRNFPFAVTPEHVAACALRGSRLGLATTLHGFLTPFQWLASKLLPHSFIMACWDLIRR